MSKMSKAVDTMKEVSELRLDETVTNFMGGDSYKINPLDTLKMIAASSIMGEPSYYRDSKSSKKYCVNSLVSDFVVTPDWFDNKTTDEIFTKAIDKALVYDFLGTLHLAVELRDTYNMRLNPQVIMVRAAVHPYRKKFTSENPGVFGALNQKVMRRADEPLTQITYYLYINGGKKNNIPSILKRSWANRISALTPYEIAKYRNHEVGMIDGVRISHATSEVIDELMSTGKVEVAVDNMTWENLRSAGKSWKEILQTIRVPHMALLRNLRGIFTEIEDIEFCKEVLEQLKGGVLKGKQFPFRYWSALQAIKGSTCNHKPLLTDALEECMDIALANMPKLEGKTMCLSDNSGSAWGSFNSEYGTVTVANIDNLSSVMTACNSDEGYVGKFGDRLKIYPINHRNGVLSQANDVNSSRGSDVGGATEGGIWLFFRDAIKKKEHWDNIFIYSDMQAGHGGLYGTSEHRRQYEKEGFCCNYSHINVFKLIQDYRKKVNPKVNVFCIQTAGYDNVLIPEYAYRTNIMYGWTGKESLFASEMIKQWDELDTKNKV